MLSLKFERAGFSDHMVPENRTKNYFIQHSSHPVCRRFLLLVMGASSEIFNCLQTERFPCSELQVAWPGPKRPTHPTSEGLARALEAPEMPPFW